VTVFLGVAGHIRRMRQRRKHRTHVKQDRTVEPGVPRSFVIKHGQVGGSLAQLVRDVRQVMEPNTASRIKVSGIFFEIE
jgi:ribosome biogenesis protein SSF1/2